MQKISDVVWMKSFWSQTHYLDWKILLEYGIMYDLIDHETIISYNLKTHYWIYKNTQLNIKKPVKLSTHALAFNVPEIIAILSTCTNM